MPLIPALMNSGFYPWKVNREFILLMRNAGNQTKVTASEIFMQI